MAHTGINSQKLRQLFLNFFKKQRHTLFPSAPLIPRGDNTLLFVNSGMVQFKDYFLNPSDRCRRATSSQLCMRAGGKHNDLDDVGYDDWHLTCFEMLGNFSFGDYFKREAIQYAYTFLTDVLQLDPGRLWVSVFEEDQEAADIWLNKIGINPKHLSYLDRTENFWSMGATGPCGPCSEIFYDRGSSFEGGPPGSSEQDGARYIEIWNLVFTQYNQHTDGSLEQLSQPCVDTGIGLERLLMILQDVQGIYKTDLFTPLVETGMQLTGCNDPEHSALHVLADHIRSACFMITEDIVPSNEGRGYILRRIIRRALRHGHRLGAQPPFFYHLVTPLIATLGSVYPNLGAQQNKIEATLRQEEEQFSTTLAQGMQIFQQRVAQLKGRVIPGELVFQLYDTYGFPKDMTGDMARELNFSIDSAGFDRAMATQRKQSREASHFKTQQFKLNLKEPTHFTGYEREQSPGKILALLKDSENVQELNTGERGIIILDTTPFYAEGGGQIGDRGTLRAGNNQFQVSNTFKYSEIHLHEGQIEQGKLSLGDQVQATISSNTRLSIQCNHSATHLLHAALRQLLGEQVQQKGSCVNTQHLRFDFSYTKPITPQQLIEIETIVNNQIYKNLPVTTEQVSLETAKARQALALFDAKYGEKVRLLNIGDFSLELCGGTHVKQTGEIGLFKIISESSIASGIRRIEACTGGRALQWIQQRLQQLEQSCKLLHTTPKDIVKQIEIIQAQTNATAKNQQELADILLPYLAKNLIAEAKNINGLQLIVQRFDQLDIKLLRQLVDQVICKKQATNVNKRIVILLARATGEDIQLVSGTTPSSNVHAAKLLNVVAQQLGGKGGGRPNMAQGGGKNPALLKEAFASIEPWLPG